MNLKEGFKRISISIGYLSFILIGGIITSGEDSIFAILSGYVLGFFIFKGILSVFSWIIDGFKNKE